MNKEDAINIIIASGCNTNKISDGYHTFGQLYEHRIALFIALCRSIDRYGPLNDPMIWMSEYHSDGSKFDGWFIMGICSEQGKQVSYHLPIDRWNECSKFCHLLGRAPEFDGHTSEDVLTRISKL